MKIHSKNLAGSASIFVLGCKVNQAEASGMKQMLLDAGYDVDSTTNSPDLVVVNTCCVTSRAEGKSRRLVKHLRRMYPDARVLVTGCLAEINPTCFDDSDGRILVFGQSQKLQLKRTLMRLNPIIPKLEDQDYLSRFIDFGVNSVSGKTREFLKIQDGCSGHCSYCIVPQARGPSRSLSLHTVREHIQKMVLRGVTEVVLSGVNLGCYGHDLKPRTTLERLLESLVACKPTIRFRLSSLEPEHISPCIIDLVSQHIELCNHFHIPVQSGDNEILNLMNRPYDTAFIRAVVQRILSQISNVCIGFDIIVGFPGETEDTFSRTMALVQDCQASYLHVFPFSARPLTRAADLGGKVADHVVRERVQVLRSLSLQLKMKFFERCIGKDFSAVVESGPDPETGEILVRTDNYIPVYCPATPDLVTKRKGMVTLISVEKGRILGRAS